MTGQSVKSVHLSTKHIRQTGIWTPICGLVDGHVDNLFSVQHMDCICSKSCKSWYSSACIAGGAGHDCRLQRQLLECGIATSTRSNDGVRPLPVQDFTLAYPETARPRNGPLFTGHFGNKTVKTLQPHFPWHPHTKRCSNHHLEDCDSIGVAPLGRQCRTRSDGVNFSCFAESGLSCRGVPRQGPCPTRQIMCRVVDHILKMPHLCRA